MKKAFFAKTITQTSIVYIIVVALIAALAGVIVQDRYDALEKDRDAIRISDINHIRYALTKYYESHGVYPVCLYATKDCPSLEGSFAMTEVPLDPLTNGEYSYAALGKGVQCSSYHLGISLERKTSQALLTGTAAPPRGQDQLCKGSAPDFSGLSFAPGGELCNAKAGIAQPTDSINGETCFDVKP